MYLGYIIKGSDIVLVLQSLQRLHDAKTWYIGPLPKS
jgi:hypothetical protein